MSDSVLPTDARMLADYDAAWQRLSVERWVLKGWRIQYQYSSFCLHINNCQNGFLGNEDNYQQVYENGNFEENKSSLGHEVIAGGAAFAGFKAFEDHQRKEGKPVSHQFAKELLAGFAGAEVDKLAETKGEDWFDREKAKRDAEHHAERMYDEHYIDNHATRNPMKD
ncbi:hypothetical protein BKA58DRAFT_4486 [Alternaria rosae]|uniref:uncharacterized protein n=1 Tax=Alternaria rosae TaxID=1187941 RepID=UPI001E8CFD9A|nr:uncharacterized protein BKA58DRAFT_4486 [Alternaria rosae]KAH6881559.1 hypothetical protein BKA58DRAFT_4486 [Alternaria rosae]